VDKGKVCKVGEKRAKIQKRKGKSGWVRWWGYKGKRPKKKGGGGEERVLNENEI
jgi:hypothetical protein